MTASPTSTSVGLSSDADFAQDEPGRLKAIEAIRRLERGVRDRVRSVSRLAGALVGWPFRAVGCWRVDRHVEQRLCAFNELRVLTRQEKQAAVSEVARCERALSRVDFAQEVCRAITVVPWLVMIPLAAFGLYLTVHNVSFGATPAVRVLDCMSFLLAVTATWRSTRRILPKQRFLSVGSRLYRQRPWRIASAMAVAIAAGTLAVGIDPMGNGNVAALELSVENGVLVGAMSGVVWVIVRFAETLAGSLLEYAETFAHPRAVLLDNHIAMLGAVDQLSNGHAGDHVTRQRLLDQLEMSARCIERGLRRELRCGDPASDGWVRNRTAQMAAAVRGLKINVVSPDTDVAAKITEPLTTGLRCSLSQQWGQMPVEEVTREPAHAIIPRILATILLVGFPLLLLIPGLHPDAKKESPKVAAGLPQNEKKDNDKKDNDKKDNDTKNGIEKATRGLTDWDTTMQALVAVLGSTGLLLSRLDDITNWVNRRPAASKPVHA